MKDKSRYEQWLDWFIVDHKVNTAEILVEGIINGEPCRVTVGHFLDETRQMNYYMQDTIKTGISKRALTGGSYMNYLRKVCREYLETGTIVL